MAVLADSNVTAVANLTHCRRRRAPATSSFQFIGSPRRGNPAAIDMAKAGCHSAKRVGVAAPLWPIASLLWIASQRCAFRPFINGQKKLRRAALPPTDRESCSFFVKYGPAARQALTRREACRPAGRAADQVRAGHQSQDRQGARPDGAPRLARARRRGDRIECRCCSA